MKRILCPFFAVSLALAPLPAQAEFSTLTETVLISVEDTTASSALNQAQRLALTRIVDSYLRSKNPPPLRNSQIILNELWPNAKTFFESQQFLEQKSNLQTTATVKIQFKVKTRELTQAVDKILVNLQAKKATYRLAVLVYETVTGEESAESSLRLELENTLLAQGYAILDPEYNEKMNTARRAHLGEILKNEAKATEMAQQQMADIVIVVQNTVKLERTLQNLQRATAHVVVKSIVAATGQKRLNLEDYIVENGVNTEQAVTAAGKNAGYSLGMRLSDDLMALAASETKPWPKSVTKPLQLVVGGLNTYRRQAIPLIKVLQEIPAIKAVELKSQGGGQAILHLVYEGSQTDLENKIWAKLDSQDTLARLDREAAAENTVYLAFKPPMDVILTGITDYRKQALPFIKILKAVAKVKEIDTHSFGGTQLVLHVYYDGLPGELESGIWEKLEGEKDFPPLFRDASSKGQIKFNLLEGALPGTKP